MNGGQVLTLDDLPPDVQEKLRVLERKYNVGMDELLAEYSKFYFSDVIQQDPTFRSDNERHRYVIRVLIARIASRPPTVRKVVVPFGYTDPRPSRSSGLMQSRIYVGVFEENKVIPAVIVCRGDTTGLANGLELFNVYETEVSGNTPTFFAVPNVTRFEKPRPLDVDPYDFLVRYLDVKPITIKESVRSLSRTDEERGFVDEFDLRAIKGIVVRWNRGTRPDESKWGLYVITDDSILEEEVTEDGRIIPKQFTVWVPYDMVQYDVDSEVIVVGTVRLNQDNIPFMNGICVIPVHAKPVEVVGSE